MAKDVNIHLKTTGAEQTKQQLEQTAQATGQVGDQVQEIGRKAQAGGWLLDLFIRRFAGPLGFLHILNQVQRLTHGVAEFFDKIKQRSDEAVRQLEQVAGGFDGIFEALNAFDVMSQQAAMKETYHLFQKTGTPEAIGLPIVEAYIRQFKDQMPPDQYQQGLETMLSYGARHGKEATPALIEFMGGMGMNQPGQQAAFTRQIAAASQAVKLPDETIISALGKGVPTIKAMGWTPEQALEAVATMAAAAGPNVRMRNAMPTAGLQAIMDPQAEKLAYAEVEDAQRAKSAADKAKAEFARTRTFAAKKAADLAQADADAKALAAEEAVTAAEKLAEDPIAFLRAVEERRATMTRERYTRLLREIYKGAEGGLAVGSLREGRKDLPDIIQQAKSAEGAAADRAEEERYKYTITGSDAVTKARAKQNELDVTENERLMESVRVLGATRHNILARRGIVEPLRLGLRAFFLGNVAAKNAEYGAFREWGESLPKEEDREAFQRELSPTTVGIPGVTPLTDTHFLKKWQDMTPLQKWQALTQSGRQALPPAASPALEQPPPSLLWPPPEAQPQSQPGPVGPVSYNYDHRVIHQTIFNPVVGMNKQDLRIEPPYLG